MYIHQVLDSCGFHWCGFHLCAISKHPINIWFVRILPSMVVKVLHLCAKDGYQNAQILLTSLVRFCLVRICLWPKKRTKQGPGVCRGRVSRDLTVRVFIYTFVPHIVSHNVSVKGEKMPKYQLKACNVF